MAQAWYLTPPLPAPRLRLVSFLTSSLLSTHLKTISPSVEKWSLRVGPFLFSRPPTCSHWENVSRPHRTLTELNGSSPTYSWNLWSLCWLFISSQPKALPPRHLWQSCSECAWNLDPAGNPTAPFYSLSSEVGNLRWSPVLNSYTTHCNSKTLSQRGSASPCPKHDRTSLQICSDTPALHCPAENHVLNHQSPVNAAKSQKHFFSQPQNCSDPLYHTVLGETEAQKSDPPKDPQLVISLRLGLGLLTPRLPSPNASKNLILSCSLWP